LSDSFVSAVEDHVRVIRSLVDAKSVIEQCQQVITSTLAKGCKLLLCGNGGSAADSQHIAAEFVVRYNKVRAPMPAMALTTDSSILTAHANDFGFRDIFARQVKAFAHAGDCLIAISTSGDSENVVAAARQAQQQGVVVIALTGKDGGELSGIADHVVVVRSDDTALIQEAHMLIAHWWCKCAESM
jgi:D-sedoheptulose 7-phosphate isomerase